MKRNIKSAIITGPTGTIGSALSRLLVEVGIKVYAVVRPDSERVSHLFNIDGVDVIYCDAATLNRLSEKISFADAFFHFAWAKTVGIGRNDMDAQIKNVQYTIDAVRAASNLNCSVFIGAGSQAEYGRVNEPLNHDTPCFPENGYGIAKLCAGQMSRIECKKFKIDHIWPRFLSVYGPYDPERTLLIGTIKKLLCGEKPVLTSGEQIWDYLYSEDAAEALYRIALYGKNGSIYPIGSGTARPLKQYLITLRDIIDPALPLGFGEVPYGEKQVMHLEANTTALKEDTGFVAKTEFESGIQKTIQWFSENRNI